MTTLGWTILAAPCAALAALSLAPQVAPLPDAGSTRTPVAAAQELADEDGWRARLENQDLRARENDFDELVSRAAKNAGSTSESSIALSMNAASLQPVLMNESFLPFSDCMSPPAPENSAHWRVVEPPMFAEASSFGPMFAA